MQQQPPLDYSLRPKHGQGFALPKALRKLFREPGPPRTSDMRSRNVSFEIPSPNISSPLHPAQQFQANFTPPYGQSHLQAPYYGSAGDVTGFPPSTDTFDASFPPQLPFQEAFPARVSFDHRPYIPPVDEEPSPGWAKKVLQPFSRVRKLKESISVPKDDKGPSYPIFTHRDLERNNIPQANVARKHSLQKRKPVPALSGSSLDSQLNRTIGRKGYPSNFEMPRDPFIRYSVGEVVPCSRPEAKFSNQFTSSDYQVGTSAMPRQSALGLDLGDYNLMNAASFPSPRFTNGQYMYKTEEKPITSEWSSDTVSRAARHALPLDVAPQAANQPQFIDQKDEDMSMVESAPTGENVKLAKEYANRKFDEWVSRTPNVSAFPSLHNSLNTKGVQKHAQTERVSSNEPLQTAKKTNPLSIPGKSGQMEDDQRENESRRISSKTPVDLFDLDTRLSDLVVRSRRNSALKRTSHQKRTAERKSNGNLSRNLAAKMMSDTPTKPGIRSSGTMWPEDQPTNDEEGEKPGQVTPKQDEMKKENITVPSNVVKYNLEEQICAPLEQEEVSTPTKRKDPVTQTTTAHEKLQPRHWRSTEVLYQDTRVGNDPDVVKVPILHEHEEEDSDSAIGVVEPMTISSEELELLSRVQTWRSCVGITPMKKLYAPSASATEPSTMTGMNQVNTGADERASEWTSISRRVERGVEREAAPMQRETHYDYPQKYDEFNDHRASKSYQMAETRTSMRYAPAPFRSPAQESGDNPAHISFQGPPSELIRFLQYSFDVSQAKRNQDTPQILPKKEEELLIDLKPPEMEKRPQKLQFGTQHIRQMSEADSKRLFDLIGDKLSNAPHPEENAKFEEVPTKKPEAKTSKPRFKTPETIDIAKSKTKEDEAKVWELLHKSDKDGLTAMERLLNAYAEGLGNFARGNDHTKSHLPHSVTKQELTNTDKKHSMPITKKKTKEISKPSTSYNTSKTKVDDEKVENILQSIFEYVQGAGDVSQIHSTLISMHKDLLDRTKDPGQRKSIDERLMKLEQAVFAKK
ncbi:uncharacterized protein FA14DRAFT_185290 [Meira miltonrushii]|uniref:Uncharacterized protein n=1 Tax=Meira miltonrushii TaxID=1280837 RepID=A0A316VBI1_9BASI|nr:uncharacterized protein FA14DRAFT_185290 [Meira miltonrushii]PWN33603.1 hypothetical protein FA14DRAFT_185290 [Meira miltonrushii]